MNEDIASIFGHPGPFGSRPRNPAWSPDGGHLAFVGDESGTDNLSVHTFDGTAVRREPGDAEGYGWTPGNDLILWQGSTVWMRSDPARLIDCGATVYVVEANADGVSLALTARGAAFLDWPAQGHHVPDSVRDQPAIPCVEWSDGDLITVRTPRPYRPLAHRGNRAAIVTMAEPREHLRVADFLADPVSPVLTSYHRSGDYVVAVTDPHGTHWRHALPSEARLYNVSWSPDDTLLVLDYVLGDRVTRVVSLVDTSSWQITELHRETSPGWYGPLPLTLDWSPSGRELMIGTERSGWNHLVAIAVDGSGTRVLTSGPFEVKDARWISDDHIAAITSESGPPEHSLWIVDVATGERVPASEPGEFCTDLAAGPDKLAFVGSRPNTGWGLSTQSVPDLLHGASPKPVTVVPPVSPDASRLTPTPAIIEIARHDGRRLPAVTYRPERPNGAGVIFIHGNGFLQDVVGGQSPYYWREHLFNRLLARHGYHVISVDYAGSEGYGRDFAREPAGILPRPELDDLRDARDWLITEGVHADRIGAYGGSYGGYLVLAEMLRPTSFLGCGAVLRAVTDWSAYARSDRLFTRQRLDSDEGDERYAASTLLGRGATLSAPLLLLHGLRDDNVPVSHIVHLLDEIQAAGRGELVELMLYPPEGHGFRRPERWQDEFQRILTFFARALQPV